MKIKKMVRRMLALAVCSVMLFSSMTAFAAPGKGNPPTWGDVWALQAWLEENLWVYTNDGKDELWTSEDISYDVTHAPSGKKLIAKDIMDAFEALDASFTGEAPEEAEDSTQLEGNLASAYNDWYDAAVAVVAGIVDATGEYYVDQAIWDENEAWNKTIDVIWKMAEDEKILIIDIEAGDIAPDSAAMESGTYWIYLSDWEAFEAATDSLYSIQETWDGNEDITPAQVTEVNNGFSAAYTALCAALHGKAPAPEAEKPSSTKKESSEPQEEEIIIVNQVVSSDGAKSVSAIDGVYGRNCMAGVVYKDNQGQIKQAVGLTEEEIGKGVLVKSYVCESRNKEMNKLLGQEASAGGWQLLGVINNDLYKMNKGTISKIKKTGEALTVTLGIPEKLRKDQYEFAVICLDENGKAVIMQDIDADKATITVQAVDFGYWAIVYRQKTNS